MIPCSEVLTSGKTAEFESLYEKYAVSLWKTIFNLTQNEDLAAEIQQEAFLKLWSAWSQDIVINFPSAWLSRVARNLLLDYRKSAFSRYGTLPPNTMQGVLGEESEPADELERREWLEQFSQALEQLSESDRDVLILKYFVGYSSVEIARIYEVTEGSMDMKFSRARRRLRVSLEKLGLAAGP